MANRETRIRSGSGRERDHAEMLEAALARPGVREVMEVYGEWQEKDRELDAYRSATKTPGRVATTDSSKAVAGAG